jgi:DsbC/DsbD-like thiol-disulfide interchange protein
VTLAGTLEIGVCKDICIPASFPFRATLAPNAGHDVEISDALSLVPRHVSAREHGAVGCQIDPISDGLRVTAQVSNEHLGGDEAAVIEYADETVWVSDATLHRRGRTVTLIADLVAASGQPFPLERSAITLSLFGDQAAVEIGGCPAPS